MPLSLELRGLELPPTPRVTPLHQLQRQLPATQPQGMGQRLEAIPTAEATPTQRRPGTPPTRQHPLLPDTIRVITGLEQLCIKRKTSGRSTILLPPTTTPVAGGGVGAVAEGVAGPGAVLPSHIRGAGRLIHTQHPHTRSQNKMFGPLLVEQDTGIRGGGGVAGAVEGGGPEEELIQPSSSNSSTTRPWRSSSRRG